MLPKKGEKKVKESKTLIEELVIDNKEENYRLRMSKK